jgi:hypothetical protein
MKKTAALAAVFLLPTVFELAAEPWFLLHKVVRRGAKNCHH